MGSLRIWSLAAVAGIFVVVVAKHHPAAESTVAVQQPAFAASTPVAASSALPQPRRGAGRVTGLPDFSGSVAENGAAVVNISVVEKADKGDEGSDAEAPLSQFFKHYQNQAPQHQPP